MIEHQVEQNSPEWFKLRIGLPTASEFHKIITPASGHLSKQWKPYASRLIWEKLLNTTTLSLEGIQHIEDGKTLEPVAVQQWEFVNDAKTRKVGFVTSDDGLIGASPDRFIVGQNKTFEVKCPTGPVHMHYMLFGHGDKYRPQIQGQLYVCEMDEGVFYSYSQVAPPYEIPTHRDDAYIRSLSSALDEFTYELQELTEKAKAMGTFQAYADLVLPLEAEHGDAMRRDLPGIDDLDQDGFPADAAAYGEF